VNELKLGIIGLSEGNGHPYSWSAIFNGYDPEAMKNCPFPVIPEYLSRQKFPDDAISGAVVTHVWTQETEISRDIAAASLVENVVDDYTEMIGRVDAILLARDDAEHHFKMAAPFLAAGMPIYIDKPLATSVAEAEKIFSARRYNGQIFTCSALAYADEFRPSAESLAELGPLRQISASVMKDWGKYGVHVIEPVLKIVGEQGRIERVEARHADGVRTVRVRWASGLEAVFAAGGHDPGPPRITLTGESAQRQLIFSDTYAAFKNALQTFVSIVRRQEPPVDREFVMRVVRIIEGGKHAR